MTLERERKAQKRDDVRRVDPQRVGGIRTFSLDEDVRGIETGQLAYEEPGFAVVEDDLAPDDPKPLTPHDAQLAIVREVVAGLSSFEQDVYFRAFSQRMSTRDIAAELHGEVSQSTVQRTVDHIKAKVAEALGVAEDATEGTDG